MAKAPALTQLTMAATKAQLVIEDDAPAGVYDLPSHLFEILLSELPPLALHKLQTHMPFEKEDEYEYEYEYEYSDDCLINGRKRKRNGKFDAAWKALFKSRWPELIDGTQASNWQQMYWQAHLQNCFDEAAELALLPSFGGCIGDMQISDGIQNFIGCKGQMNRLNFSKLSYHCQQFGQYARCLRLRSVFCVAETCQLLKNSKLQSLVLQWIRSEEHVDGSCKLLIQNSETLESLKFSHCRLLSTFVNAICASLVNKTMQMHGIQHFSINSSSLLELSPVSLPLGLVSFLSSGRSSLSSLKFCDNHLDRNFARMLFSNLIDASSSISVLDLSENNIAGWLSNFNWGLGKSMQSLRVLNIRGNNLHRDDVVSLRYALAYMPSLEILDISDNPIGNDGIRCLVPYFLEAPERCSHLAELNLENCELSCDGVTHLVDILQTIKRPLNSLSLEDNGLGSQVAGVLGKLLGTSIKRLNIGGIGFGSAGFQELQERLVSGLKLVEINISKNRGGIETAKFLSKLIPLSPDLVAVNAAYNLMPVESLNIICSALKVAKGKLERLDLTGNNWGYQPCHDSVLAEFQHSGRPILILPSFPAPAILHDDDP